jgi:CRP-like cAMP-binding protein
MPFDDTLFLKTKVDILSFFNEEQLRRITPDIERKVCSKGETIVFRGEVTSGFYIVKKGKVSAVLAPKQGPVVQRVLDAGDFFGEMSLFEEAPAKDTVRAAEDGTEILVIGHESFQKLLAMQPLLKKALADKIASRSEKK